MVGILRNHTITDDYLLATIQVNHLSITIHTYLERCPFHKNMENCVYMYI